MQRLLDTVRSPTRAGQLGRMLFTMVAAYYAIQLAFHLSIVYVVDGVVLGSLYGVLGVSLILIYRTNRIINFAAAAIGSLPAVVALVLDAHDRVPYLLVLPIALIGGPLLAALVDVVVMRRFKNSPRLIVTVVTLAVAQSIGILGFFTPIWLGASAKEHPNVPTPWDNTILLHNHRGQPILTGNQVAALVTVILLSIALAAFLRYTRIGIAIRASSENADRASLLGIPVLLVGTAAWALAGLMSAMAIYVQAPLIGLPQQVTLGFDTLLYGLAAAVVARMERIGVCLIAGMYVGLIIFGSVATTGDGNLAAAIMLVVILIALLVQRGAVSRAMDAGTSTWEAVKSFRPIPAELREVREVVVVKRGLISVGVVIAVVLPFVIHQPDLPSLALLPIYGIVGVSLVVLTGWAGQISLGQFGLVGAGALATGGLIASHNIDFFAALGLGIAAGVVAALLIGLPAVRIQGLYLAVTTLAFSFAMEGYFLNKKYWIGRHLLPKGLTASINRPVLYGRIDLENGRAFYYVCVILLALTILAAYAFRRNRSGRILIAARDNQRAAPAYSINLVRTRLAAFAVSGGMAGMAGVLIVYLQHQVVPDSFSYLQSINVFLAATVGGLTSVGFAASGAITLEFFEVFGPRYYRFLGQNIVSIVPLILTGPLAVINLYQYPGGSAQGGFNNRDRFLRWVARRHDIHVPSLVADRRVEDEVVEDEDNIIEFAERHVEAADSDGMIGCPVCGAVLTVDRALEHDHLQNVRADDDVRLWRAQTPVPTAQTPPGEPILVCRGIDVAYDQVQVLFGVDLDVNAGEIIALLGTNGAGKSTLLKAVSGLVDPKAGSIVFDGVDITHADAVATSRMGIIQVPGGKAVFPTLTVAEHFRAGTWLYAREAPAVIQGRINHVLELFPRLRERWEQMAGNLSGGEQQQLALGMAFVAQPRLLIIDELSLGLAPTIVEQLLGVVRDIHASGCTIVIVEQSVNVALTVADRAYFMEKGEVRFSGPTAELLDRGDILRSVFLEGASKKKTSNAKSAPIVAMRPKNEGGPVLSVRDLTKRFGGITAVNGVSFDLQPGQILGLIGPNGAGKTTIFDLLSGLIPLDRGRIIFRGRDITRWGPDRRAAIGLGRSFQDARIFPSLTVAENIAIGLERHLTDRDHLAALLNLPAMQQQEEDVAFTVDDLIGLMGFRAFRDKFVAELSTGSRRIVDLAMAIAHDPSVLILDEPSSGIAQRETEALGPLLKRIQAEAGCAMLVIEHDMPLITSVSDEIIALELGAVICQAPPAEVIRNPVVISSYLGGDIDVIQRSGVR